MRLLQSGPPGSRTGLTQGQAPRTTRPGWPSGGGQALGRWQPWSLHELEVRPRSSWAFGRRRQRARYSQGIQPFFSAPPPAEGQVLPPPLLVEFQSCHPEASTRNIPFPPPAPPNLLHTPLDLFHHHKHTGNWQWDIRQATTSWADPPAQFCLSGAEVLGLTSSAGSRTLAPQPDAPWKSQSPVEGCPARGLDTLLPVRIPPLPLFSTPRAISRLCGPRSHTTDFFCPCLFSLLPVPSDFHATGLPRTSATTRSRWGGTICARGSSDPESDTLRGSGAAGHPQEVPPSLCPVGKDRVLY